MFQKPSQSSAMSSVVKIGAGVAGAKLSDGVVSVMPESTNNYKKLLVTGVALLAAASVNPKTTAGEAVQAAFVGMAVKQGTDYVTEMLVESVPAKDNTTTSGKFLNAVIGHTPAATPVAATARLGRSLRNPVEWEAQEVRNTQPQLV
jgi:hypothetical protein